MTPSLSGPPVFEMPQTNRVEFLAVLLREVTLRARGAYVPGTCRADDQRLRVFNELSHRIAIQLAHLLQPNSHQFYPDDVFVQMILDIADQGDCGEDLKIAFAAVRRAMA